MIRLIEALNYRCLRYIRRPLRDFQILIGPNASGKTTFLDVVTFLRDLLDKGLDGAITERSSDIQDLFSFRQGDRCELAVELEIPKDRANPIPRDGVEFRIVRYEVAFGLDRPTGEHHIFDEQVILRASEPATEERSRLFPDPMLPPETIMHGSRTQANEKRTVRKVYEGNDSYYPETKIKRSKGSWAPSFRLGPRKSALANMPADEQNFPVSTWLRKTLIEGTEKLMLNSLALRKSSPPGLGKLLRPDGSNLPWVVSALREDDPERFRDWIRHLRTALPDLCDIWTIDQPDMRSRYLEIEYEGGLRIPSWTTSDGTLRMLALTLPAFLTRFEGVYLIEEPENGIHPMAIETVYQGLKSIYDAQILLATHSPVILGCAELEEVLCFKKHGEGATAIVSGSEHPALQQWKGALSLPDLYASGILG
jgi:predicted ATPase